MKEIQISSRVSLYFNDSGFRFAVTKNEVKYRGLLDWKKFKWFWLPYERYGIKETIYKYCDSQPDYVKSTNWYQGLKFE